MGKTYAITRYLETREPRVICLDPFDDFKGLHLSASLDEALSDLSSPHPCRRRVVPPMDDRVDPETGESSGSREYAELFFSKAISSLRDCLIVLDEMTLWSGQRESKNLQKLILQGRRLGLRLLVACQRVQLVPGVLLSEATEFVFFRVRRPRDLDVVEEWAGLEVREHVSNLEQGQCVLVDL